MTATIISCLASQFGPDFCFRVNHWTKRWKQNIKKSKSFIDLRLVFGALFSARMNRARQSIHLEPECNNRIHCYYYLTFALVLILWWIQYFLKKSWCWSQLILLNFCLEASVFRVTALSFSTIQIIIFGGIHAGMFELYFLQNFQQTHLSKKNHCHIQFKSNG